MCTDCLLLRNSELCSELLLAWGDPWLYCSGRGGVSICNVLSYHGATEYSNIYLFNFHSHLLFKPFNCAVISLLLFIVYFFLPSLAPG